MHTQRRFFLPLLFLAPVLLFSQLSLNLNFEQLSVEGVQRPWGWNVYAYSANAHSFCDTTTVHSGNYSLSLENQVKNDSTFYEMAFFIEPTQILNKKLKLEGWIKTDRLNGTAGIRLFTVGAKGEGFAELAADKTSVAKSFKGWKKYSLSLSVDEAAHSIYVSAYLSGSGKIYFDDFSLFIEDQLVREVPVAPSFSPKEIQELGSSTRPFVSVRPSSKVKYVAGEYTDLYFFKEMVGDARIIALGEATHGTSEFFQLKHRLLQYAIHELGVRVFVLEDNQLLVERINQFVLKGKGTAREVIRGLFAVWNTQEMLDLIRWVRAYNAAHPDDQVEFVGMDVQNPQLALDSLVKFLGQRAPTVLRTVQPLLEDYRAGWQNAFFMPDSTLSAWESNLDKVLAIVSGKKASWLKLANSPEEEAAIEWAIQNARLLTQNMASVRSFGFEGRDKAMAENVEWILDRRGPDTKMIVWAHDSHINRGEADVPTHNYFSGQSMGAHLADKFGDDYRAFGLFTYQGSCRGTISYSDFTQVEFELFTSPVGSLDEGLHQLAMLKKSPLLLMNLGPLKNKGWLNIQRPVRYVGYVAEDYGFGGRYVIPKQFDGLFFVDKTKASKKIID